MPPNKEENFEAKRQQIIDGALDVFARKGFEKATNKEIAQAAGIKSPGLIYHYFQDKRRLYGEVLEQRIPLLQLLAHAKELEDLPLPEALTRFGQAYLQLLENPRTVALLRLIVSDAARHPNVAQIFWQAGPNRALNFLADYLERQMEAGHLRRTDPHLATMQFMGPLVTYALSRTIFVQAPTATVNAETVLESNVTQFLNGMRPDLP